MRYLLLSVMLLSSCITFAQKGSDDVFIYLNTTVKADRRYDDISLKFHEGFVVRLNGDTLSGKMLFVPLKGDTTFNLVINNNILPADSIESIRVKGSDTTYSNLAYTEFKKLRKGSNIFYRKLMKGQIELYDDWLVVDEQPGEVCFDGMMIGQKNSVKNVTCFWTTSDKRFLIRKVNDLMKTNLQFHEFRSKYEVLKWLKKNI